MANPNPCHEAEDFIHRCLTRLGIREYEISRRDGENGWTILYARHLNGAPIMDGEKPVQIECRSIGTEANVQVF